MMVVVSGVAFSLGEFVLVEKYLDLSPRVQGRGHRFEPPLMVVVVVVVGSNVNVC